MRTPASGFVAAAVALGVATAALPAAADDLTPPEGATPVVGMAYEPGASKLWLAGPGADKGRFVEAESGDEWTFGGDPVSVQALAWSDGRLWVGDIGDKKARRDYVAVFRLGSPEGGRSSYFAYDMAYEDGPHDARAMLISGRGNIYIVTTGDYPGVYRAPAKPSREKTNTLTRVADAPEGVTDGVFLTDGSTMALRTKDGIAYIDAFSWETRFTYTIVGAPEGESITIGQDDEIYVGGNPTIRTADVPTADTTTTVTPEPSASPSASATAEPSASSTPSSSASPEPDDTDEPGLVAPSRRGTLAAIALAGLLAVAAGAVTFLVKR